MSFLLLVCPAKLVLPVGDKLMQYDTIAVNAIVKNKDGEVSSCDILYVEDLDTYSKEYIKSELVQKPNLTFAEAKDSLVDKLILLVVQKIMDGVLPQ